MGAASEAILRADLEKTKSELEKALDRESFALVENDSSLGAISKDIGQKHFGKIDSFRRRKRRSGTNLWQSKQHCLHC